MRRIFSLLVIFLIWVPASASHEFLVKPMGASASSKIGDDYSAEKAINGVGLDSDLLTNMDIPSKWPSHHIDQSTNWISGTEKFGTGKSIDFDLGATFVVSGFHAWNYYNPGNASSRGAKLVEIQYLSNQWDWISTQESMTLDQAPSTWDGYTGVDYRLSNPITARKIRFLIKNNWGDIENIVSIGEVRFFAQSVVNLAPKFIVKPVGANASSLWSTVYDSTNTITGRGLSVDLKTGASVPSVWPDHQIDQGTHWISGTEEFGIGKSIEFDLGGSYILSKFHVWNYCNTFNASNRGAKDVTFQYQDITGIWVDAGVYQFDIGPNGWGGSFAGSDYTLPCEITARNVRFLIHSNWGDPDHLTSIGEVRFIAETFLAKPMSAEASSFWSQSFLPGNAINGSGLSFDLTTGMTSGIWPMHGATQEDHWISGTEPFGNEKWIQFDLGNTQFITGFHVWNYNNTSNSSNRGVKNVVFQYQDGTGNWVNAGTFIFLKGASSWEGETGANYFLESGVTARKVRFIISSNWGDSSNLVSIGELRFFIAPRVVKSSDLMAVTLQLQPGSAMASSTWSQPYLPINAINGSGLFGNFPVGNLAGSWPMHGATQEDHWISGTEPFGNGKWIQFDFDNPRLISGFHAWNYNNTSNNSSRGAKDVSLQILGDSAAWSSTDSFQFKQGTSTWAGEPGYDYILNKPILAQKLRFLVSSNWSDPENLVSIGEVRFLSPVIRQKEFQVGWYDQIDYNSNSPDEMVSVGAGISLMYIYNSTNEQVKAKLDQAAKYNLKIILELPRRWITAISNGDTQAEENINNFVRQFDKHPALAGWYTADEPSEGDYPGCKKAYELIKQSSVGFPYSSKPVFIVFCFTDNLPNLFSDSYDIALIDNYPCNQGDPEFTLTYPGPYRNVINAFSQKMKGIGKPWWAVLQGVGRVPSEPTWYFRLPTFNEMRFMLYYAIDHGATGWLSWMFNACKESQASVDPFPGDGQRWADGVFSSLAEEISVISTALAVGPLPNEVEVDNVPHIDVPKNWPIVCHLWMDPNSQDLYLIAINQVQPRVKVSMKFKVDNRFVIAAIPLFENRGSLPVSSDGSLTDDFSSCGVHVYKLICSEPSPVSRN
ncbi:discoidin domain-containing protein [Geothrix sp. 21YS21S-4]|uniref:discoidin domain-containing protein n=1 Tax=Geothrix sp. 21YS21S-4 TaxID=3068889 RepID=UPI0027BB0CC5|nr:discoidin domain-containing protein [Geothrix sp. 21YS21S-4]